MAQRVLLIAATTGYQLRAFEQAARRTIVPEQRSHAELLEVSGICRATRGVPHAPHDTYNAEDTGAERPHNGEFHEVPARDRE